MFAECLQPNWKVNHRTKMNRNAMSCSGMIQADNDDNNDDDHPTSRS